MERGGGITEKPGGDRGGEKGKGKEPEQSTREDYVERSDGEAATEDQR